MAEGLILNEELSDVELKVRHGGYTWRFPSHTVMLNFRSSAFREMLEARAQDKHPSPLTVIDISPDTALALLKNIYTGAVPTKITANLLVASKKYGLEELRDQLEEKLIPNLTVPQACEILEGLDQEQPMEDDCVVRQECLSLLKRHAYRVFASDLVLSLSKKTLYQLLESPTLNLPDESIAFWGLWRWGIYHSSKAARPVDERNVVRYIDEFFLLIRYCSLRNKEGISESILCQFNTCASARCRYSSPGDFQLHSTSLQTCGMWEDVSVKTRGEKGILCLQISFDKDVMLLGLTFEACTSNKIDCHIQVFEESSGRKLSVNAVKNGRCISRKLSRTGEPEPWIESDVRLSEPLILPRSEIFSIYLLVNDTPWAFPSSVLQTREKKFDSTFATFHGQSVVAVRELHLVPDMTVTWGSRR